MQGWPFFVKKAGRAEREVGQRMRGGQRDAGEGDYLETDCPGTP